MTIEQAWLLVLDHYHDTLPPELQWRPETKCNDYLNRYADQPIWRCDSGHEFPKPKRHKWRGEIHYEHAIPAPELTDAAAMAVLNAAKVPGLSVVYCPDFSPDAPWESGDEERGYIYATSPRDAIILAAAELAQKERENS